jgi:hypothetical protein
MNLCACGKEGTHCIDWQSFGKNGFGFYCSSCYPAVLRILDKYISQMRRENGELVPTKEEISGDEDQAVGACVR